MTRTAAAAAVLSIVAATAYVATAETPQCSLATVFMPCEDAHALGSDIACSAGETVGIVTAAKLLDEDVGGMADDGPHKPETWLPVAPEAVTPIACDDFAWNSDLPDDRVQVVPTEMRYPSCLVGEVERAEQGGESPTPAEPPHVGVCCAPGCRSAGKAEAIAPGGPKFYECDRLHRVFPDTPCGG